mgnify:CR=1 FL=1
MAAELVVLANPPEEPEDRPHLVSTDVHEIRYVHAVDGQPYRHQFRRGDVQLRALPDGSLELRSAAGRPLWANF